MRFVRSEASERSKKIEANTMPSMPYMALAYYMCWLFLMMKKRTWRTMQHTIPAAAAAAAASTSTTLAILCIKAYFSHTRVSHIFTCLQSSRISRLSPLEFPHSWRKQVLLLLSLLLLEPCTFFLHRSSLTRCVTKCTCRASTPFHLLLHCVKFICIVSLEKHKQ